MEGVTFGYAYQLPSGGCVMRIRNMLSQFSDVFSEFNRYLAPAYHHDRCERQVSNLPVLKSVPMRLYSMHKRELVVVFLAFFACLGLVVFIGLTGPPITLTVSTSGSDLLRKQNISQDAINTGPFILHSPLVSSYAQQMWLIMTMQTDNSDGFEAEYRATAFLFTSGFEAEYRATDCLFTSGFEAEYRATAFLFTSGFEAEYRATDCLFTSGFEAEYRATAFLFTSGFEAEYRATDCLFTSGFEAEYRATAFLFTSGFEAEYRATAFLFTSGNSSPEEKIMTHWYLVLLCTRM
ncbi:hypothetical protein M8J76_011258 [Diaphorina citri]|nr:hypothetical protein M8J76_011258 [Diaphorina citri]